MLGLTVLYYLQLRPAPVALRVSLPRGDVQTFRVTLAMRGTRPARFDLRASETTSWRVTAVGRGVATIDSSRRSLAVSLDGHQVVRAVRPASALLERTDGAVLAAGDPAFVEPGGPGLGVPGLEQLMPALPPSAVAPGQSWSRRSTQAFGLGTGSVAHAVRATLLRIETIAGVRAAVVRSTLGGRVDVVLDAGAVPAGAVTSTPGAAATVGYVGTVAIDQTAWIAVSDGRLLRTRETGSFDLTLTPTGFPSLFPTFDPGRAPLGSGLPFGGGAPLASAGAAAQSVRLAGTFSLSADAVP